MSKRDTFHSFQDIDSSLFRDSQENGKSAPKPAKTPAKAAPQADIADEAALFLEAVAGNIDISLKNTPMEKTSSSDKKKAGPVTGVAVSLPPVQGAGPSPAGASPVEMPSITAPSTSEDERLFASAMDGVRPVNAKGRDLAPCAKPAPRIHEAYLQSMDDIFSGKLEFSLEYTEEFIQGHVVGVDPAIIGKLRAGAFSPEGHLDLHGQNLEQAYAALAGFIKHAYQSGKRHLLVITGRGKNSPGGTPVLRERVQAWFTRDPFKRVVLAFCTAKPSDGGAGAVYLLLRKRKKNQGKIVWDRRPSEEELLS